MKTEKEIKNGRCMTCQHCKRIAEKDYKTYCFAFCTRDKNSKYRRNPIEVQLHFKCSNGKYKFYGDC